MFHWLIYLAGKITWIVHEYFFFVIQPQNTVLYFVFFLFYFFFSSHGCSLFLSFSLSISLFSFGNFFFLLQPRQTSCSFTFTSHSGTHLYFGRRVFLCWLVFPHEHKAYKCFCFVYDARNSALHFTHAHANWFNAI